jgi:hypothetical protein
MAAAQDIIFFLLIVGGAIAVLRATGTIDAALGWILRKIGHSPALLIGIGTAVFAIGSATLGASTEYIPFAAVLVALCLAMGRQHSVMVEEPRDTAIWLPHVSAYGVLADRIENLWSRWWRFDTPGTVIAAFVFASLFLDVETAPNLRFFARHGLSDGTLLLLSDPTDLQTQSWKPENITFLHRSVSAAEIQRRLRTGLGKFAEAIDSGTRKVMVAVLEELKRSEGKLEERLRLWEYGLVHGIGLAIMAIMGWRTAR